MLHSYDEVKNLQDWRISQALVMKWQAPIFSLLLLC